MRRSVTARAARLLALSLSLSLAMALGAPAAMAQDQAQGEIVKIGDGLARIKQQTSTGLTLLRNGVPVTVGVEITRLSVGGGIREGVVEVVRTPALLQLGAGEIELHDGDRTRELDESAFVLIGAGRDIVISTDDDSASLWILSVEVPDN